MSSSFTPQKLLLIFLTIFAIQSVLLLFLVLRPMTAGAQARAGGDTGEDNKACPCRIDKDGHKIDTTRLYIPIPGVTDACGWVCDVSDDGRGDIVDYIFTVYKLLIGIAAIVAFAMIVYAGYEWIFAMGNSGKIGDAKERIMSAFIGLGLALASVQFLQTLSPQLTNLYLPDVTKIARASVNPFCRGSYYIVNKTVTASSGTTKRQKEIETILKDAKNEDVKLVSKNGADAPQCPTDTHYEYPVAMRLSGDSLFCYLGDRNKCAQIIGLTSATTSIPLTGEDGEVVNITMEKISPYQPKEAISCVGSSCTQSDQPTDQVCYPKDVYARSFECKSAQSACNATDDKRNGCEEVNKWLAFQGYISKKCAKREMSNLPDDCILGGVLSCPFEFAIKLEGDKIFSEGAKTKCWEEKGQSGELLKDCNGWDIGNAYPVLSGDAVKGANALCCTNSQNQYHCETKNTQSTIAILLSDIQSKGVPVSQQDSLGVKFASTCNTGAIPNGSTSCFVAYAFADQLTVPGTCNAADFNGEVFEVGILDIFSGGKYKTVNPAVCVPDDPAKKVKLCYGYTSSPFYKTLDDCLKQFGSLPTDNNKGLCQARVVFDSTPCDGETTGTGGPQSSANPLLKTTQQNPQLTPAFKTASADLKDNDQSGTFTNEADAESFLESLALVESAGGTKVSKNNDNPFFSTAHAASACGIMQLTEDVAKKYNAQATCEWMNKVENFDESVAIAAQYVADLLNHPSDVGLPDDQWKFQNICPDSSPRYGACYYSDPRSATYSPCRDVMRGSDINKKLPYLYGAYNGGADANCNNDTNFYGETGGCGAPPQVKSQLFTICPAYKNKQGSVWECDRGDADNPAGGYSQTRKGATRLIDCMREFQKGGVGTQAPSQFSAGSCCASADCLVERCSIQ